MNGDTMALLKVNEAAKELNCSPSLVYQAISDGRLRCHRIGKGQGGIRISREQLEAFLKETELLVPSPEDDNEEFRHPRPASR